MNRQKRKAVELAKICRDAESRIRVSCGKKKANGKEVFTMMNLYAVKGDELEFLVEGGDEEEILQQIQEFCILEL